MSNEDLKPCPFCGAEPLMQEHEPHTHSVGLGLPDHPGSFTIECPTNGCCGLIADTWPEAIAAWNRRAAPSAASIQHDSDCSTNNRGVPDLLGPCDCSVASSAPADTTPLPKWIDDQKGKDPLMDDMIAYIECQHRTMLGFMEVAKNANDTAVEFLRQRDAAIAASQQAAPKPMTEAQHRQLSRCLSGGVNMGWISDVEANALGDVIEAAAGPNAALVKAMNSAMSELNKWRNNGGVKAGYEFIDAAIAALASLPPTQEAIK